MKQYYQQPRIEISRVELSRLLLTDISVDGQSLDNGGNTSDIDSEDYDVFIHAGTKQRGLWDDTSSASDQAGDLSF